ncbi:MAG: histidine phosphatase family protein [Terriglobia bacterium]
MTEIYLVRHGQSIHNLEERIAGQQDSYLTALGIQDASDVASSIGRSDFDVIYCSDLLRARQTAEAIRETLTLTCPMVLSPLLRELDYGEFTEKSVTDAFAFLNYKLEPQRRYPGGEGFLDLEARVERFLMQLKQESGGRRILVVAHAGTLRLILMVCDPAQRQLHLERGYGNRFLGKVVFNSDEKLRSVEILQNPARNQSTL